MKVYVVETTHYPFHQIRKAYTTHESALTFGTEYILSHEHSTFIIYQLELEQ